MPTLKDLMGSNTQAEVVCLMKRKVVRKLEVDGDRLVIDGCTGKPVDVVSVPLDTAVHFQPWIFDRGNMVLTMPNGQTIKFCTEADLVRFPDGSAVSMTAPEPARNVMRY